MNDLNEIIGTYGAGMTQSTIYTYYIQGATAYAVHGSSIINLTYEEIEDGVNVEEVEDYDTVTSAFTIESKEDLWDALEYY